jgi:hypothetical protein
MTPLPGGFHIDYRALIVIKALLAGLAAALLLWDLRIRSTTSAPVLKFCNRALLVLGVLSFAAWWNFGALHGSGRPVHLHDIFHYYVGSKYYAELQYTRLYQCVAVEEVERGRAVEVARRWTRNLVTNELEVRTPTAAETEECLTRFGPERWQVFRADVEWFRNHLTPVLWQRVQMDYGYNATPTWSAVGHWLVGTGPASVPQVLGLASIDSVLILILAVIVWRTFGWAPACVAAIWWGLYESGGYGWLGGAFLRQDALFCIVCSVCALRAKRPALAGGALAAAALLRAFPIILLAGLAIKSLWVWRKEGLTAARVHFGRFAAGFALTAMALAAVTTLTWASPWRGSLEPWKAFAANSRKHLATPSTNRLGLKTVLSFSPAGRAAAVEDLWLDSPWDTWKAARTLTFEQRKPLYWIVVLLFLAVFAASVTAVDDWIAIVLAVTLLPIVASISNYYYSILLVLAFLWPRDKSIGVGLVLLAALTAVLPAFLEQRDDRYVVTSAALVLLAFWVVSREALPTLLPRRFGQGLSQPAG